MYVSSYNRDKREQFVRNFVIRLFKEIEPAYLASVLVLDTLRNGRPQAVFTDIGAYEVTDIAYDLSLVMGDRFIERVAYYKAHHCLVIEFPVMLPIPRGVYRRIQERRYAMIAPFGEKAEQMFQQIYFERLICHRNESEEE